MISPVTQRTEGTPTGARTMWRPPALISSRASAGPGKRDAPGAAGTRAVKKTWTERVISAGSRPPQCRVAAKRPTALLKYPSAVP